MTALSIPTVLDFVGFFSLEAFSLAFLPLETFFAALFGFEVGLPFLPFVLWLLGRLAFLFRAFVLIICAILQRFFQTIHAFLQRIGSSGFVDRNLNACQQKTKQNKKTKTCQETSGTLSKMGTTSLQEAGSVFTGIVSTTFSCEHEDASGKHFATRKESGPLAFSRGICVTAGNASHCPSANSNVCCSWPPDILDRAHMMLPSQAGCGWL